MTDNKDICAVCGKTIQAVHRHQIGPFFAVECRQTKCPECSFVEWFSRKHLCRLPLAPKQYRTTIDGRAPKELKEHWAKLEKEQHERATDSLHP